MLTQATHKDPELLRVEPEGAIRANQALLATALDRQRRLHSKRHFLIDAHAIIDNDQVLVRVPLEAVRALDPDGIILLEAPAEVIEKRRAEDARHRPRRSIAEIDQEREVERETVLSYARDLGLPMATGDVIGGFELDPLIAALEPGGRVPQ